MVYVFIYNIHLIIIKYNILINIFNNLFLAMKLLITTFLIFETIMITYPEFYWLEESVENIIPQADLD